MTVVLSRHFAPIQPKENYYTASWDPGTVAVRWVLAWPGLAGMGPGHDFFRKLER